MNGRDGTLCCIHVMLGKHKSVSRLFTRVCDLYPWAENDQVLADGEPAGPDQVVPILPPCGARSEGPAGGRRGSLLLGPHEGPGDRRTVKYPRSSTEASVLPKITCFQRIKAQYSYQVILLILEQFG